MSWAQKDPDSELVREIHELTKKLNERLRDARSQGIKSEAKARKHDLVDGLARVHIRLYRDLGTDGAT